MGDPFAPRWDELAAELTREPSMLGRDLAALGRAGTVLLVLAPDVPDEAPTFLPVARDEVDYIPELRELLPHDGGLRAVAFADPAMDRWEARAIDVEARVLGPVLGAGAEAL